MGSISKWKIFSIYLKHHFFNSSFSFEDAFNYLSTVDLSLSKASWNAMIKNNVISLDVEDQYKFNSNEDEDNDEMSSSWIEKNRKCFSCEQDKTKRGCGDFFSKDDFDILKEIYFTWKRLCYLNMMVGCRRENVSEPLTEGLCSALFGWARTNNIWLENIPSSTDLVDVVTGDAIQVKGISTLKDEVGGPSSFGPRSEFTKLIAVHIKMDEDKAYFYELDISDYKNWKVNGYDTLEEQQNEKRRPRLPLLPIIEQQKLTPIATFNFNGECFDDKND